MEAGITISCSSARRIVDVLMRLGELPSTREEGRVATEAWRLLALIDSQLPTPYHHQPWESCKSAVSTVLLDHKTVRDLIEFLECYAWLRSSPRPCAQLADEIRVELESTCASGKILHELSSMGERLSPDHPGISNKKTGTAGKPHGKVGGTKFDKRAIA
jgi:hypothetical protein